MAMNQWVLLGLVLNCPVLAYLLIGWLFRSRYIYVTPPAQPSMVGSVQKHQSPPVSGAGPPGAGTGGETG